MSDAGIDDTGRIGESIASAVRLALRPTIPDHWKGSTSRGRIGARSKRPRRHGPDAKCGQARARE